jgi:hypothetical protein
MAINQGWRGTLGETIWLTLFSSAAAFCAFRIGRDAYGKVVVDISDRQLVISETLPPSPPMKIDLSLIDCFWIRCELGEDGPTGPFTLMCDQRASYSRALIRGVAELAPLVFLAESLGRKVGVGAETRADRSPLE